MTRKKPDLHRLLDLQKLLLAFRAVDRQLQIPPHLDKFENDAEHSYSLAMMAWFLADHFPHLDRDLVIRFALAHDLVEIYAGDTFSYSSAETLQQKHYDEAAALKQLRQEWPDFPELLEIIEAYESRDSAEAKFIYALDKLLPALVDYLNEGRGWHHHNITFAMFCEEKNRKIPLSPEVNQYCRALIKILETQQYLFPSP